MNRFRLFIFTLLLSCFSLSVTSQEQDEAQIKQLFTNYMEKYNHYIQTGTLNHTPSLYSKDVMVISDQSAPKMVEELKLYRQVELFLDSLKKRGVSKVNWEKVDIHMLGDNMALASNVAIRHNKQGKVVDRVGASYHLYQQDGEWKIVAFAIHSSDKAFRFNPATKL